MIDDLHLYIIEIDCQSYNCIICLTKILYTQHSSLRIHVAKCLYRLDLY